MPTQRAAHPRAARRQRPRQPLIQAPRLSAGLLLLVSAGLLACDPPKPKPGQASQDAARKAQAQAQALQEARDAAWSFSLSQPPYLRPREHSATPQGLGDMRAATCGACHQEIYKEWALSTHRRAWLDDVQFMRELEKSRGAHEPPGKPRSDVGWMCVNCHTPMMNQQDQWVTGLEGGALNKPRYVQNPEVDRVLQEDAITCATCHVRQGVVYGPYGDTKAPHPTAKDPNLLTEQICTSCHQATAQFPELTLGCFFTTGQEHEQWKAQGGHGAEATCQSCHMPEVERKVAEAFDVPVRKTRRHWFGGSLIPKKPEFEAEFAPLRAIYGSGAAFEVLAPTTTSDAPAPECVQAQTCQLVALLRVTNEHAGHGLPTGDPERHIIIKAEVLDDASDSPLQTHEEFVGDRYQWWPTVKRLSEGRLMPGQRRDVWLTSPSGSTATQIKVEAVKYRMHLEAYEHHKLEGQVVRGRTFHRSTWRVAPGQAPTVVSREDDKAPQP